MRFISYMVFSLWFFFGPHPASAGVLHFDISNLVGFTENGVGGTAGNGVVFTSPIYTVGFGASVDFGTAFFYPDPPDGRAGSCEFAGNCFGNFGTEIGITVNGIGGYASAPFELDNSSVSPIFCGDAGCPAVAVNLRFDLPQGADGIQFSFQGEGPLTIAPPVPELQTWAMMILGFVGVGLIAHRRRKNAEVTA